MAYPETPERQRDGCPDCRAFADDETSARSIFGKPERHSPSCGYWDERPELMPSTPFEVHRVCRECREPHVLKVWSDDLARYIDGKTGTARRVFVQDAFPYLSADDRELLVSNTCGKCYDKMAASFDKPLSS